MNPSNFTIFPSSSVANKCEAEQVAVNIMGILERTGNKFRPLAWGEYVTEREKDGNFNCGEQKYFNQVIDYCLSATTAKVFSNVWKIAGTIKD